MGSPPFDEPSLPNGRVFSQGYGFLKIIEFSKTR